MNRAFFIVIYAQKGQKSKENNIFQTFLLFSSLSCGLIYSEHAKK
jgi:hypothetical protein